MAELNELIFKFQNVIVQTVGKTSNAMVSIIIKCYC